MIPKLSYANSHRLLTISFSSLFFLQDNKKESKMLNNEIS